MNRTCQNLTGQTWEHGSHSCLFSSCPECFPLLVCTAKWDFDKQIKSHQSQMVVRRTTPVSPLYMNLHHLLPEPLQRFNDASADVIKHPWVSCPADLLLFLLSSLLDLRETGRRRLVSEQAAPHPNLYWVKHSLGWPRMRRSSFGFWAWWLIASQYYTAYVFSLSD